MIELLKDFPNNVVAVTCEGNVTAEDYNTILIPAIEQALAQNEKVRLYYEIGADFTGVEPGAMWADTKVGMEHFLRWERIAVVTDVEWIRMSVRGFGFLMPAKVEVFSLAEAPKAREWILAA